jgi:REP-associated tyrosine transposase
MSHSYPNIYIHCIFSTRHRVSSIPSDLQVKLSKYVIGIGKNHGMTILQVGGTANHLHVLLRLPAEMAISKAVQVLKANSSRWLREHGRNFSWQEGYGAFSVSASNCKAVEEYIAHQDEHHAKRSF